MGLVNVHSFHPSHILCISLFSIHGFRVFWLRERDRERVLRCFLPPDLIAGPRRGPIQLIEKVTWHNCPQGQKGLLLVCWFGRLLVCWPTSCYNGCSGRVTKGVAVSFFMLCLSPKTTFSRNQSANRVYTDITNRCIRCCLCRPAGDDVKYHSTDLRHRVRFLLTDC